MPRPWRCVAFDLDGTLVDSLPALRLAYEAFLQSLGSTGSEEEFEHLNGPTMATIVSRLKEWHGLAPPHDELLHSYQEHVERAYRTSVLPAEGADDLLRWSRAQGLARALVTSTPRRVVEGVLAKLDWPDCFEVIACGDEVADAKPDPAIYARACKLGGWEPDECVAVEDAPAGVRAAAACGMAVIGVGPAERLEALRACGAAWTCETLKQVRDILHTRKTHYGFGIRR